MTTTLIDNIGLLVTNDPSNGDGSALGIVRDAAMVIEAERVAWVGRRASAPDADARVDLDRQTVVPGFVDSHSHLIFASDRADEFASRMAGTPYTAGGIAATLIATREASDSTLRSNASRLVAEMVSSGTTTVEIKSGYGLTTDDEVRGLAIAQSLTTESTFLGAHVVPIEYQGRRDDYVSLVAGPMLDACAPGTRWIDVFCDRGAFSVDEARLDPAGGDRGRIVAAPACTSVGADRRSATGRRA